MICVAQFQSLALLATFRRKGASILLTHYLPPFSFYIYGPWRCKMKIAWNIVERVPNKGKIALWSSFTSLETVAAAQYVRSLGSNLMDAACNVTANACLNVSHLLCLYRERKGMLWFIWENSCVVSWCSFENNPRLNGPELEGFVPYEMSCH